MNFLRFLQQARVFSLSEIMFNILSASTWIILKNKMLSEKGRLQKDINVAKYPERKLGIHVVSCKVLAV